ncbi:MAG: hypothetical protein MUP76_08345 [Acidimicrobiia bacterium]|nr:hypothetical protein [Acidimicrobiia bacterium]
MRQTLKIGFTVLVVAALTMSGIALAQTDDTPTDEEISRGVSAIVEKLAPLIEDGTINQAQAEAVAGQLAGGFGPHRPNLRRPQPLDAAAEFLGMEVADLASQLREGATLAEIAGDQTDGLIAAMVADAGEHLAQAVTDGKMTQEEADEKLADVEDRITTFVNEGPPERPEGAGGPGRPGGHRGPGGFGPGGEPPASGTGA